MNTPRPLPQGKQRGADRFGVKDYHHHAGLAHSYLETAKAHLVRAKGLKGADAAKYHALAKEHLAKAQEHIGHAERHASFKALAEEIEKFSVQAGASFNPALKETFREGDEPAQGDATKDHPLHGHAVHIHPSRVGGGVRGTAYAAGSRGYYQVKRNGQHHGYYHESDLSKTPFAKHSSESEGAKFTAAPDGVHPEHHAALVKLGYSHVGLSKYDGSHRYMRGGRQVTHANGVTTVHHWGKAQAHTDPHKLTEHLKQVHAEGHTPLAKHADEKGAKLHLNDPGPLETRGPGPHLSPECKAGECHKCSWDNPGACQCETCEHTHLKK